MAKPWSQVEQSTEYQDLPESEKQSSKQQYFDEVVARKPEFQQLSNDDKIDAKNQFFGNNRQYNQNNYEEDKKDSIINNMNNGQDLVQAVVTQGVQHPFKSILQPVAETITGKSLEEQARDKSLAGGDVLQPKSRPFDSNLGKVQGESLKNNIEGQIGDLATSPINYIGGAILKGAGGLISKAIPEVKDFVSNAIYGIDKAKEAADTEKFALGQKTAQQISDIRRVGKLKLEILNKNSDAVSNGYDDLSDNIKRQISKYSDKQGLELQKNLPRIFGKKSSEYGDAQDNIIKSLSDEDKNIPSEIVSKNMEKSLIKYGILRTESSGQVIMARSPMTPTEQQIFSLYENTKKFNTSNIEDLIKTQKYIEPEYGKSGWSPDDKLRSDIARGISENVSESVPELKKLKSDYAPFLQWKNAAIDNLKPFNNQYEVASSTLSRAGSTKIPGLDPSGERLMAQLQKVYQSPYGAKINALNKGLETIGLNKEDAAREASEGIKRLRESISNDIANIRQGRILRARDIDIETNKLVRRYKDYNRLAKLGIVGAGGTLLEYFIRREAYSKLSVNP